MTESKAWLSSCFVQHRQRSRQEIVGVAAGQFLRSRREFYAYIDEHFAAVLLQSLVQSLAYLELLGLLQKASDFERSQIQLRPLP